MFARNRIICIYKLQHHQTRPEHDEQHSLHASEKASIGAGVELHCTDTRHITCYIASCLQIFVLSYMNITIAAIAAP